MGYQELGSKLRAERKRQGLTQQELCSDFLTRNMLSRIENGVATPSLETLSYLSSRLGLSAGYFLDDFEDERSYNDRRVLEMIKEEYQKGNYLLCLDYFEGISEISSDGERLLELCLFRAGLEKLKGGELNSAVMYFDKVKAEKDSFFDIANEARMYSVFIRAFLARHEAGDEINAIMSVRGFSGCFSDLVPMARIFAVKEMSGVAAAEALLSVTAFRDLKYRLFTESVISLDKKDHGFARIRMTEALGCDMLPIFVCYGYTVLEKCAAVAKDFENAYAYSQKRKELVKELTDKKKING